MSVFDTILAKGVRAGQGPARGKEAREWFRLKAREVSGHSISSTKILLDSDRLMSRPEPGKMYHFLYDPKLKKTLPYYDSFPLIFMVEPAKGGFYGINLHYLAPKYRALLMDALYDLKSDSRYDDRTRLAISYKILKNAARYKYFKPTFKHYLSGHVESKFVEIAPVEWDIALFLQTAKFQKASRQKVYADSAATFK